MGATPREPSPSGLGDAQWAALGPLFAPPVPAAAPRKTGLREVLNAIFSILSTGGAWSALPHDFPPEGTVRDESHRWRRRGPRRRIHGTLRRQVRGAAATGSEPSAGSIDSQTVAADLVGSARVGARGRRPGGPHPGP
jgi:transposase